jgi:hypothetical protein
MDNNEVTFQVFDRIRVRIWVRESTDDAKDLILDLIHPLFQTESNIPSQESRKRRRDD